MLLSLNILNDYVDLKDIPVEEISDKLTMATAETEGFENLRSFLKTIYTAKILKLEKHPDADKLTVVQVSTGTKSFQVVCGAKNHKQGDIVALATEGTDFGEGFIIKKAKLRGIESNGMLCSARELGLSEDHSGILIFPPDTPLGVSLDKFYSAWMDTTIEIDNKSITHRPDLWGHYGFARELSAIFKKDLKPAVNLNLKDTFSGQTEIKTTIENTDYCPRYCCLAIKNIKVEESPEWLKARLAAIGLRPVNNIVDATNYIMAEIGEPMHAFDLNFIKENEITIRAAKDKEKIKTLDDQEFELMTEDIVITNQGKPVALAGVMGGENSSIKNETTSILLEAANFNPVNIRKTEQRYNLRTDAAIRFEKSLSPEICSTAIIRCFELIKQLLPEAEADSILFDNYPKPAEKKNTDVKLSIIRQKLGADISDERILEILRSLHFGITQNGDDLHIEIPSYRATKDIDMEADIVEEVGRIFGYDNITPIPPLVPCAPPQINEKRELERKIKDILSHDHQMNEVYNYSFVGEEILNKLDINNEKELRLKHPLSTEADRLRLSLLPNLVNNIVLNQKYNNYCKFYEVGRGYIKENRRNSDLAQETFFVSGVIFEKKAKSPLFYEAKNAVKDLLQQLQIKNADFRLPKKELATFMHPYRAMTIYLDGDFAGTISEIHPKYRKACGIKGDVAIFELNLDKIYQARKKDILFKELQKYPEVPFEVSVLADKKEYVENITKVINKADRNLIKGIELLSIYEGDPVPEGKKSVSLKITFCGKDKTLSPQQIEELQNKIIKLLNKNNFNLR